jgi:predicted nuclease of restriction endonuclease-like (RecB) superfamily
MGTAPVGGHADITSSGAAAQLRCLLELGRDFAFVGEQYLLPVGGQDFRLDLLFYHRELQSLIAIATSPSLLQQEADD